MRNKVGSTHEDIDGLFGVCKEHFKFMDIVSPVHLKKEIAAHRKQNAPGGNSTRKKIKAARATRQAPDMSPENPCIRAEIWGVRAEIWGDRHENLGCWARKFGVLGTKIWGVSSGSSKMGEQKTTAAKGATSDVAMCAGEY